MLFDYTEWYEEAGELSAIPLDESIIPEHDRIPRVTSATWKYDTGAVGSLTHAIILRGTKYSTELEIYADGYQLRLLDPYNNPTLRVRSVIYLNEGSERLLIQSLNLI